MKNVMLGLGLIVALSAFHMIKETAFVWTKTMHDYGQIKQGTPVSASFEFLNEGDEPLMILSAKASCGCTVADYTKGEIQPGKKGTVRTTYNAAKVGSFQKSVTIQPSVGDPIKLKIKGEVI
ncbi:MULTISPECIES: DUF1573 domain-containing protein [Reichenbachiella]|uniref:DUF1573 domain-containing protein n=1 Tax=Reichenbachiella agariperforans TaxID=156994 RepID=A0A1M6NA88_REIAG|nr:MULTISPECIES: DUF1573 domain-containing protein [Reichenbachiella]RJE71941.1 hypothetical protein BGP76_07615 [Reichenbachiella sp. MSK19-1]SHJ92567.1 Protein of unknown function [Reichenbachiella agariperforans]